MSLNNHVGFVYEVVVKRDYNHPEVVTGIASVVQALALAHSYVEEWIAQGREYDLGQRKSCDSREEAIFATPKLGERDITSVTVTQRWDKPPPKKGVISNDGGGVIFHFNP